MDFISILSIFVLPVSSPAFQSEKSDLRLYSSMWFLLEDAGLQRACASGDRHDESAEARQIMRQFSKRIDHINGLAIARYGKVEVDKYSVSGLARPRDCTKVLGAERQLEGTIEQLEDRLGGK